MKQRQWAVVALVAASVPIPAHAQSPQAEQVMDAVEAGGSQAQVANSQRQMHVEAEELAVILEDHVAKHMSELAETEENVHRACVAGIQAVWVAIIVALALSLGTGFYTARSVLTPIYLLSAATESVSRGDLDVVVNVRPGDETGVLARAFNQMANSLQQTVSEFRKNESASQIPPTVLSDGLADKSLWDAD